MAFRPVYAPEDAAKILWRLILSGRARIEDFDVPPPGFNGAPESIRNLAREFEHYQNDPEVINDANHYLETHDISLHPETVQAAPDPRDFAEPGSDLRRAEPQIYMEGQLGPLQRDGNHQLEHERRSETGNRAGQAKLGTEGEPAPLSSGSSLDW